MTSRFALLRCTGALALSLAAACGSGNSIDVEGDGGSSKSGTSGHGASGTTSGGASNPFGGGSSNPFGGGSSNPFGGGSSNPFGGGTATTSSSNPFGSPSSSGTGSTGGATTTSSSSAPPGLHVEGNTLVDGGKTVRLLGVDRSGTEYSCVNSMAFFDGPVDQTAVSAMLAWHINAVRVPLNEDCWLGINGAPGAYSGTNYQNAIAGWVSTLRQNNLYVILDLHWNSFGGGLAYGQQQMADEPSSPTFWASVAGAYKDDLSVVFDLYNEPHDIAWSCWQNGGCQVNGVNVAGMNQLIAAVRGAGANNVVMAGGLSYAGDLSEWLANKPSDPLNNLAASTHNYNFSNCADSSCWTSQLAAVAASVPLITGEMGENDCASGFIDGYMGWADGAGVSYLGWAWNADFSCNSGPSLITNYDGTPSGMGAGFQSHLATVNP